MNPARDRRGYSLTEVLVAVTLFSIVATGLGTTTVTSTRSNKTGKNLAAAATLVQDTIEQLRTLDPDTNPAALTAGTHNDPLNPINAAGDTNGWFTRTWTVTRDTPARGLSRVVVTVSWSGGPSNAATGVTYICTNSTCS